jgi:hypothetical protein
LEEFKLASPDVHVVSTLASDAVQFCGGSSVAHGLYALQSANLEKHSCCA